MGKVIRQCFVASEGKVLISADYSQIEMRILAHLCGEGVLVDAFNDGEDVHLRTAQDIAEEGQEATPEMRTIAKAINYGLIYGMSAYRLARELNISRDEASTYMKRYFERYPEIQSVLDSLIQSAGQNTVLRKQCLVVSDRSLILTALIKINERLQNELPSMLQYRVRRRIS